MTTRKPAPPPVATLLIDGTMFCCAPCQISPEGTRHHGPHSYSTPVERALRTGIVRVEWVDRPPKRKRAKIDATATVDRAGVIREFRREKRGKGKRKGGRRG